MWLVCRYMDAAFLSRLILELLPDAAVQLYKHRLYVGQKNWTVPDIARRQFSSYWETRENMGGSVYKFNSVSAVAI